MPTIENKCHIDIDDVAVLQRLVAGDTVADHVIERGTRRFLVAAVHQGGRQRAMIHGKVENQIVDFFRGHARTHVLGQHVQAACYQLAGLAHGLKGGRAVNLDLACFA